MCKRLIILIALVLMLSFSFASLTDNITSYYKFDETSGTTVIDSTGTQNQTNSDVTINQTGIINKSYLYQTNANYVTFGDRINGLTSGTISLWFKKSSNETKYLISSNVPGVWIVMDMVTLATGKVKVSQNIPSNKEIESTNSYSTSAWNHLVFDWNSAGMRLTLNGVETTNATAFNIEATSGYVTYLGRSATNIGHYLNGYMDEIGIWTRRLSTSEISALYNSGSGLTYPFVGEIVTADFNYVIDYETEIISLTDNSSVFGALEITDWNWLKDGNVLSTDQNTSFSITPNTDYNICLTIDSNVVDINDSTCKTIEVGGELRLNFYDDDTNNPLDEMYLEFNGTPYYSDTNTFIRIGLETITNGLKSILLQKTGYQEKSFSLELNEYSDYNYDLGFILSSKISNVQFQVFTELGATQPNTTFMAIDNYNGFIIDFETTDSLGRVTFILNNQKEDYNFYSDDLNFGTTIWTINKPVDAVTLAEISGDWKYSITGNSYSNATNIASGITKLLLQNTVNPYYMSVQDVNESYVETTF